MSWSVEKTASRESTSYVSAPSSGVVQAPASHGRPGSSWRDARVGTVDEKLGGGVAPSLCESIRNAAAIRSMLVAPTWTDEWPEFRVSCGDSTAEEDAAPGAPSICRVT